MLAGKELGWPTNCAPGSRTVSTRPAAPAGIASWAAACTGIGDTVEKGVNKGGNVKGGNVTLDAGALLPIAFSLVSESLDSLRVSRTPDSVPPTGISWPR